MIVRNGVTLAFLDRKNERSWTEFPSPVSDRPEAAVRVCSKFAIAAGFNAWDRDPVAFNEAFVSTKLEPDAVLGVDSKYDVEERVACYACVSVFRSSLLLAERVHHCMCVAMWSRLATMSDQSIDLWTLPCSTNMGADNSLAIRSSCNSAATKRSRDLISVALPVCACTVNVNEELSDQVTLQLSIVTVAFCTTNCQSIAKLLSISS